jgi:hypothetical protein
MMDQQDLQVALRQALRIFISQEHTLWRRAAATGAEVERACEFHIARALQDQVGWHWHVDLAYHHGDAQPSQRVPPVVVHRRGLTGPAGKVLAIEIVTRATPAVWRRSRHLLCELQWDLGYQLAALVDLGAALRRDVRRASATLAPRWEWFGLNRRYPTDDGQHGPDEQMVTTPEEPVFDPVTLETLLGVASRSR